jgi:hypothetical protein
LNLPSLRCPSITALALLAGCVSLLVARSWAGDPTRERMHGRWRLSSTLGEHLPGPEPSPIYPPAYQPFTADLPLPVSQPPDSSLGTDELWWDGFAPRGAVGPLGLSTDTYLLASTVFRGELVVAGEFAYMDGAAAPGIARWDGRSWRPLGEGLPLRSINCLLVHGDLLFAGCSNSLEGGMSTVMAWDGQKWSQIGAEPWAGPFTTVSDMAMLDGELIATGRIIGSGQTRNLIVRWTGTQWEDIGPDSLFGDITLLTDLAVYRETLYVSGIFALAAGDTMGNIASWRGGTWEIVGGGTNGYVSCMDIYGDQLISGGRFERAGDQVAHNIAAWDGTSWSNLGEGLQRERFVFTSAIFTFGSNLFVMGEFDTAGKVAARGAAKWNGTAWDSLPAPPVSSVFPVASITSFEQRLITAGHVVVGPDLHAEVIALEGDRWVPLSSQGLVPVGTPRAVSGTPAGLVADGEFALSGELTTTTGIAAWNGSGWRLLSNPIDAPVSSFAVYRDQIVATGWFKTIGAESRRYIARYDGQAWQPLGSGLNGPGLALAIYGDELIVGGQFSRAGGIPVSDIAAWDGQNWRSLGDGIWSSGEHAVIDLQIYKGELYAGGRFSWAGSNPVWSIAKWNGTSWVAIDAELLFENDDPWVFELEEWQGQLAAAGTFASAGGRKSGELALWDGLHWQPVTPIPDVAVTELLSDQGRLVVGGIFFEPNGRLDPNYIQQWDGENWWRMGSGLSSGRIGNWVIPGVTALTRWNDALHAGGTFRYAGSTPSFHIARWDGEAFDAPPVRPTLTLVPNPAANGVNIGWHLSEQGDMALRVFDATGRQVARPLDGPQPGGPGAYHWQLTDAQGRRIPSGVYFLRLESHGGDATSRVVILR